MQLGPYEENVEHLLLDTLTAEERVLRMRALKVELDFVAQFVVLEELRPWTLCPHTIQALTPSQTTAARVHSAQSTTGCSRADRGQAAPPWG